MSDLLWQPSKRRIANSNMTHFQKYLEQKTGKQFANYLQLHEWSTSHIEAFWESFVEFASVRYNGKYQEVITTHKMPGARWFPGMQLNYAENMLSPQLQGVAVKAFLEPEPGQEDAPVTPYAEFTFAELRTAVARCASALRRAGIRKGDRVAGYIANVPEAIIASLACAALGAIWSSASPDFGLEALCDRFGQVEPKLVFATTHYDYGGKTHKTTRVVQQLKDRLPTLERTVAVPYPRGAVEASPGMSWEDFLQQGNDSELSLEQVEFSDPLYIMFSSGTTGAPKCMVHATGGTLLQHQKEHLLHCDLKAGDALLFFTTCGWMMWNWQLSALSVGSTICLYDGSPGYPSLNGIWQVVDQAGVTHFGTSGRFVESCMKQYADSADSSKQSFAEFHSLKSVMYTGSPLSPDGFKWIYTAIKQDVHLAGISGGTDIVSCFILGNPNLPVYAGEIQCKGLGVDVVALDEQGEVVAQQPGELVCRKPIPSMPVYFLDDPDGEKYRQAYFDTYPGLWRHGDYVEFTETGGVFVHGRSDATLNPGGVRIGSAEIYSVLSKIEKVLGSVVVGWKPPGQSDEVVLLFVVLPANRKLDLNLETHIRQTLRSHLSPRHVPSHIFQISEIPQTRSGKTVELSVKAVLTGKQVTNRDALANPDVLIEFEHLKGELLDHYRKEEKK